MKEEELSIVPTSEIAFGIKTDGSLINNVFKKDNGENVKWFLQGTVDFIAGLNPNDSRHIAFLMTYILMGVKLNEIIMAKMSMADVKRQEENGTD